MSLYGYRYNIFEIGDRVVAVGAVDCYDFLEGRHGTVVHIAGDTSINIGVEFDEPFPGGHDCGGHGHIGRCRYGNREAFEFEEPYTIKDINPDQEETEQLDAFLSGYLN